MKKRNKAVFLDRDGVIIKQVHHITKVKDMRLIPKAALAVKKLNQAGYLAVIITNQAMVAYGMITEKGVQNFHKVLHGRLNKHGAKIDAFYFCPHHAIKGKGVYKVGCECRKPKTGMFKQAARELGINFSKSFAVGDKWSDLIPAAELGNSSILVLTGYGKKELPKRPSGKKKVKIAKNLLHAVDHHILKRS